MVTFNLTGLKNGQITGDTLLLGVSVRLFLEMINILISTLRVRKICPPQHGQASFGPLRAQLNYKGRGRTCSFSLLELGHAIFPAFRHWRFAYSIYIYPIGSIFLKNPFQYTWCLKYHTPQVSRPSHWLLPFNIIFWIVLSLQH